MTTSIATLFKLGEACQCAYNLYESGKVLLTEYELVAVLAVENECYGYLAKNEENAILVFRGTCGIEDWTVNNLFYQKPFPRIDSGLVHAGFLGLFQALRTVEGESLEQLLLRDAINLPLYIAGHSLGGALAILAAVTFDSFNPILVTFGSPKVGDREFALTFDSLGLESHCFVNPVDVVTNLPLNTFYDLSDGAFYERNWQHVGNQYSCNFNFGTLTSNHLLDNYVACLVSDIGYVANNLRYSSFDPLCDINRSSQWTKVRALHLKHYPKCVLTDISYKEVDDMEVHHVKSFHEHPELELEPSNLRTIRRPFHWLFGHFLNWEKINSHFDEDIITQKSLACLWREISWGNST